MNFVAYLGNKMLETRREDTGQVCNVVQVEKCCRTCAHYGFAPDGCGDCAILVDYEDGKLVMTLEWDPETQAEKQVPSHPMVGDSEVCEAWEQMRKCEAWEVEGHENR